MKACECSPREVARRCRALFFLFFFFVEGEEIKQKIQYNLICEHNFEAAFEVIEEKPRHFVQPSLHSQPWQVKTNTRGSRWRQYRFLLDFFLPTFHTCESEFGTGFCNKKKEVEGSSRHFGNFTRIHKRLKSVLCEEEAIVGWGPVSKLQGLEKWESNAWLFVNCLASPWVQPEFVSKKKNKVTWTFSWLFPPASPLFPPFLATGISQSSWRERELPPPPLGLQILFPLG